MAEVVIGVLALQGGFAKHVEMLQRMNVSTIEVRTGDQLNVCDALIIPGGESTTMLKHIQYSNMRQELVNFFQNKPVFGTCAGLIIISSDIVSHDMEPFALIDVAVERNAFGRQAESFKVDVDMYLDSAKPRPFTAVFIRAPRIRRVSPEVQVLASYEKEPILVRQGFNLGATFHPELTTDPSVHQYFLGLVKQAKKEKKARR